jgi:hypothetical protein
MREDLHYPHIFSQEKPLQAQLTSCWLAAVHCTADTLLLVALHLLLQTSKAALEWAAKQLYRPGGQQQQHQQQQCLQQLHLHAHLHAVCQSSYTAKTSLVNAATVLVTPLLS